MANKPYIPLRPSELGVPDTVWRHELGPEVRAEDKRRDRQSFQSYLKWDRFRFDRIDPSEASLKPDYPLVYQAPGWALVFEKRPSAEKLKNYSLKRGWWPFEFYRTHTFIFQNPPRVQQEIFDEEPWQPYHLGDTFADSVMTPDMIGGYHAASKTIQVDDSELRKLGMANFEFAFKPLVAYAMKFPPFSGG